MQLFWINNAIAIRNENFDNSVFNALNRAANQLESTGNVSFMNQYMLREFLWPEVDSFENVDHYLSIESFSSIMGGSGLTFRRGRLADSSMAGVREGPRISAGEAPVYSRVESDGDSVALIISVPEGASAVMGADSETSSSTREQRVVVGQDEYVSWLSKRMEELQNISDQMISELSQWESRSTPDSRMVDNTLSRMLDLYGIKVPYEFIVLSGDEIAGGDYSDANLERLKESEYGVSLFPDRLVGDDMVLKLIFPEKREFLIGSMMGLLTGSLIFSLVILSTFGLSLYLIVRQKKISEMKADFVNNMTHEFKTPIATISLAADTIVNPRIIADEKGIKHFVGMIKKENSRMNRQVETILQLASLDRHEIDFKFSDVSLHSIIEKAIESMEIQVRQKNGIITPLLEAVDSVIYGDPEHLTNLMHNLLDNANKYSPDEPDITVETGNRDDGIFIRVTDKGVGMTKSVQSKIFDSFYRQPVGNIHNVKGFGLGLSYVKKIVDAHKGVIEVTSETGKGSSFEIYLPFNWED